MGVPRKLCLYKVKDLVLIDDSSFIFQITHIDTSSFPVFYEVRRLSRSYYTLRVRENKVVPFYWNDDYDFNPNGRVDNLAYQ